MSGLAVQYKEYKGELNEGVKETELPGLFISEREVFGDERGDFWEAFRTEAYEKALGREVKIKQMNRSRNVKAGTLRGIHVADWDKIIFVSKGTVFVALADLRVGSPTYGKVYTQLIGDGQRTMSILVPAGFGNSYQTVVDDTDYIYAVTDVWSPGREVGVAWNDPILSIDWPIKAPILSDKDKLNKTVAELQSLSN